jgi:hypothetical protein
MSFTETMQPSVELADEELVNDLNSTEQDK